MITNLILDKLTFLAAFALSIFGLLKACKLFVDGEVDKAKEKSAGATAITKLTEGNKVIEADLVELRKDFDAFVDGDHVALKVKFEKFIVDYYNHIQSELSRFQHLHRKD